MSNWSGSIYDMVRIMVAVGIFCLLLVAMSWGNRHASKESRAYNQVIVCVASIPSVLKTEHNVDMCWDEVERETGTRLKRYDQVLDFSE